MQEIPTISSFDQFELDNRLLRALIKMGVSKPTPIQEAAVKFGLSGKDIVGKARTGSGKTIAYLLPLLHKILKNADEGTDGKAIKAIVLVPTRELAEQVQDTIKQLVIYCAKEISVCNIATSESVTVQAPLVSELPDIIVSTPSKILAHFVQGSVQLADSFQSLVIDEADLVLSFGYEADVKKIFTFLPNFFQTFLMSATLSDDVDAFKTLLRNPVVIKLEVGTDEVLNLTQYSIRCVEQDKFLLLFFILKLKLVQGKCIIFVKDIDQCYRVKLFLEQFSIRTCVLNSELPHNSRYHIVQEFNKGIYDYIIATDETDLKGEKDSDNEDSKPAGKEVKKQKPKKKSKRDKEYGVARGVDFQNVDAVVNFDFPLSSRSYTHRVGRTARAHAHGTAISFVLDSEKKTYAKVEYKQQSKGCPIVPYEFDMTQVEGFRYRCNDAMRAVNKVAIREARIKEIKAEILASEKLTMHFSEKPTDLSALRHDKALHPTRILPHMKHIPDYLLPKGIATRKTPLTSNEVTFKKFNARRSRSAAANGNKGKPKTKNPLKTLMLSKPR